MTQRLRRVSLGSVGEWFFSRRSWTPIPLILILVFVGFRESRDSLTWLPGLGLLALGEALRLWGVAVIGKSSRTRGGGGGQLATAGPYGYVRNPLYLGNFCLMMGAVFLSELLWMIPVALAVFIMQYVPIVRWEESVLSERLGADYAVYCQHVPRWFPRWRPWRASGAAQPYQWRAALWSERSTLGSIAFVLLVMLAKENLPHLRKRLVKHHVGLSAPPVR